MRGQLAIITDINCQLVTVRGDFSYTRSECNAKGNDSERHLYSNHHENHFNYYTVYIVYNKSIPDTPHYLQIS